MNIYENKTEEIVEQITQLNVGEQLFIHQSGDDYYEIIRLAEDQYEVFDEHCESYHGIIFDDELCAIINELKSYT